MAENRTLARPYARAVFELARTGNALGAWSRALNAAAAVVADERVSELLGNPRVDEDALVGLVCEVAGEADAEAAATLGAEQGRNFLRLLADNDRLAALPEIAELYDDLKDEAEDSIDVSVVSAAELDDATQAKFVDALSKRLGRNVRLSCSVDPSLIGGAVIRADDLVIDGSLKSRLGKLASALIR